MSSSDFETFLHSSERKRFVVVYAVVVMTKEPLVEKEEEERGLSFSLGRFPGAKNRGLIASSSSSLTQGWVVFQSVPYAAVLRDDGLHERDHFTFEKSKDHNFNVNNSNVNNNSSESPRQQQQQQNRQQQLQRCSATKFARYFSRENQLKDWEDGYDKETKALKSCQLRAPKATVRLASKIVWRMQRERKNETNTNENKNNAENEVPASEEKSRKTKRTALAAPTGRLYDDEGKTEQLGLGRGYSTVFDQLTHGEESKTFGLNNPSDYTLAAMTRAYLTHSLNVDDSVVSDEERAERYEREYEDIPSVADLAKLIGKLRLNCHTLCDDELRPYGIGVYPVAAMMNHSENPNCFATFRGKKMIVRCLRDVLPGEELTISYDELMKPKRERAKSLKSNYGFDLHDDGEEEEEGQEDLLPLSEIPLIGGHKLRALSRAPKYTDEDEERSWFQVERASGGIVDGGCHIYRLFGEESGGFFEDNSALASFNLEESVDEDYDDDDEGDDGENDEDKEKDKEETETNGDLSKDPEFAGQKTYGQSNKSKKSNKKKTRLIVETWGDCKNVVVAEIAERFCQAFELVEKLSSTSSGDVSDGSSLNRAWDRFNSLTDTRSALFGASVGIARGHHLRVKALESFMNAAVLFEDWKIAFDCGTELTPSFEKYYPNHHPQIAVHNVAVLKLLLERLMADTYAVGARWSEPSSIIESLDEIKEKAKELASGVSRVVGEDSTVVEQLVEAMHTCKMMREQVLKEADSLCSSDDDAF